MITTEKKYKTLKVFKERKFTAEIGFEKQNFLPNEEVHITCKIDNSQC